MRVVVMYRVCDGGVRMALSDGEIARLKWKWSGIPYPMPMEMSCRHCVVVEGESILVSDGIVQRM